MNKGRRQELKQLKYLKRIKRFVAGNHCYVNREGNYIYQPKAVDVVKDRGQLIYKTTSTPCSCWMCSGYYKYKRTEFKKQTRLLIEADLVS